MSQKEKGKFMKLKKSLGILICLVMVFSLVAACANQDGGSTETKAADPVETTTKSTEAAGSSEAGDPSEAADSSDAAGDGVFKIGVYTQMSGNNAEPGVNAKNGIDLAVKKINEEGGFNGEQVEAIYYDTTGSTEEAVKVVQRILSEGKVDAIIGSVNSNEVSACIPYINDAKVFNFGLGTSAVWMEDDSMTYTFRASANNSRVAPPNVDMYKKMGITDVAIISGTDDTGKATADAFEQACLDAGLNITTRQECDRTDTDFSGQITQIINSKPDIVFESLIGDTFGPFTKQLRNMGYEGLIGCKECFSPAYAEVAGWDNASYVAFVYPYVTYGDIEECDIPIMKEFLTQFEAAYGSLPTHESAYRGWDTMMSMWEAANVAGKNDSESLKEAMSQVQLDGLGGPLDFTKGDREGYSEFYEFILIDKVNYTLDNWLESGGEDIVKDMLAK